MILFEHTQAFRTVNIFNNLTKENASQTTHCCFKASILLQCHLYSWYFSSFLNQERNIGNVAKTCFIPVYVTFNVPPLVLCKFQLQTTNFVKVKSSGDWKEKASYRLQQWRCRHLTEVSNMEMFICSGWKWTSGEKFFNYASSNIKKIDSQWSKQPLIRVKELFFKKSYLCVCVCTHTCACTHIYIYIKEKQLFPC